MSSFFAIHCHLLESVNKAISSLSLRSVSKAYLTGVLLSLSSAFGSPPLSLNHCTTLIISVKILKTSTLVISN